MPVTNRVLILGGNGGIGSAACRQLAAAGYELTFTYANSERSARTLEAELKAENVTACPEAVHCDLTDPAAAGATVDALVARSGPFYGLVYCAGASYDCLSALVSPKRAEEIFRINFFSLVTVIKAVLRGMLAARDGRIIAISSVASDRGRRGNGIYAASKAACEGYLRCLSEEVGRHGVTVNWIRPGFIRTPMIEGYADLDELAKRTPLRRLGSPQDIAGLVVFLLSEEAAYIHSAGFTADGGLSGGLGL